MLANVVPVLDLADKRVGEVELLYKQTLHEQQVSADLQALIREVVVGYRSALERVANAVATKYGASSRATYWPNATSPADFNKAFDKNLPGIRQSQPHIAEAFERYQSYQPGFEWIATLMKLYRQEQHHDFTPQTRVERLRHVDESGGAVVSWDPASVSMSGGVFIHGRQVNPVTQMTSNTQRIIYVDWLIAETGESLLGTLLAMRVGMRVVVHGISSASGL